ncbi:hypothetical protein PVK06_047370 [Gossypium arboreum]|uniref:Uncharacterized protein n=1 Tax=Gossypium arboreum TaxID=29729 RepID=A0ABR0MDI0_GOSAR|nr:hypothetical protein PVK06_047370 [Gossypium arboreum]
MEISSSLSSLNDKVTKKVRMCCKDAGEDDHLMVVDDDGNRNGFKKLITSSVSFNNMLLGISRGMGIGSPDTISEHDQATKQGSHDVPILVENREESDMFGPWMMVNCWNNLMGRKPALAGKKGQ